MDNNRPTGSGSVSCASIIPGELIISGFLLRFLADSSRRVGYLRVRRWP